MTCVTLDPEKSELLATNLATWRFVMIGNWVAATGLKSVNFMAKIRGAAGTMNLIIQPAIQLAETRVDVPDAPVLLGATSMSSADQNPEKAFPAFDVSASTDDHMYARLGIGYKASGAGEAMAEVLVTTLLENYGKTLPARSFNLVAATNTSCFQPIAEWLPASMVKYVKAAFFQANPSHLTFQLVWQWAETSVQNPSAWDSAETEVWYDDEDLEVLTPEMEPDTGDQMWVRPGVEYKSDTEGVQAQSNLTVVFGFRKA